MYRLILCLTVVAFSSEVASSQMITIGDPSFENQTLIDPDFGAGGNYAQAPWETGTPGSIGWVVADGTTGVNFAPDGQNIASTSNDYMAQNLTASYEAGVTYTLTAQAALRAASDSQGSDTSWRIALFDTENNLLASTTGDDIGVPILIEPGSALDYQEISVSYTATPADDGKNIRIYFDSNGGSALNDDDTFPFVNHSGQFRFIFDDVQLMGSGDPVMIGDANGDDMVDILDLEIMLDNFKTSSTNPVPPVTLGNFNSDTIVDFRDYLVWETEFLAAGGSQAQIQDFLSGVSVPEPGSAVLVGFAGMVIVGLVRRRK